MTYCTIVTFNLVRTPNWLSHRCTSYIISIKALVIIYSPVAFWYYFILQVSSDKQLTMKDKPQEKLLCSQYDRSILRFVTFIEHRFILRRCPRQIFLNKVNSNLLSGKNSQRILSKILKENKSITIYIVSFLWNNLRE